MQTHREGVCVEHTLAHSLLTEHNSDWSPCKLPRDSLLALPPFDWHQTWSEPRRPPPPPAARGHVSCSITRLVGDGTIPTVLHGSTCGVKLTLPYAYTLHFPLHGRFSITWYVVRVGRILDSLPVVSVSAWLVTFWHFIDIIGEAVTLATKSPFTDVWPDRSTSLRTYWPKYAQYSRGALKGCYVTWSVTGISRAKRTHTHSM